MSDPITLKYIYQPDLPNLFKLIQEIQDKPTGLACLETLLRYLLSGAEYVSEEELAQVVKKSMEKGEVTMGTIAEKLISRGRQEGRQEGLKDVIEDDLAIRFGLKRKVYESKLRNLPLAKLRQLHRTALTVANLAEFEAKLDLFAKEPTKASAPPLSPQMA